MPRISRRWRTGSCRVTKTSWRMRNSSPAKPPVLSLILCWRNDAYMGNSVWRLETTLNYTCDRVHALGREDDVEVIVADWGSEVPLAEVVALGPAAARMVSFL